MPTPTLARLMTPAPVTIAPDASLREAVELLARLGVGALPVLSGDRVIGLLSLQSLVAFESVTPGVPTERDVSDIWEEPVTDDEDLPSVEYYNELWDDAGGEVVERLRVEDTPEWDFLAEHTVAEAMSFDPPQLPSCASVRAAARLMRRTGAHGVLVVDDGRLAGIVTTMDITRVFARGAHARKTARPREDAAPSELRGSTDTDAGQR